MLDIIIDLKKRLTTAWRDLKNEQFPKTLRCMAYAEIVSISEQITKLDPKSKISIEKLKEYKLFKSAEIVERIVWPKLHEDFGEDLEKHLEKLTALAVKITHKRLPREPQDSPLFGQIVSATTGHLVVLEKH